MRLLPFLLLFLPLLSANTLVIGVLGGWQHPDQAGRGVRKMALHLRDRNIPGVSVETFANHHLEPAMAMIRAWWLSSRLDNPALVIYGQSFGGAAVVRLANALQPLGIPIALTVQIDSVSSHRSLIPPNVTAAVNYFQREGWPLKGEASIQAADPSATEILGNFEYHYRDKKIDVSGENWARRIAFGTHLKMEDDPELWKTVEKLILAHVR